MKTLNRICLLGNIAADPESRETAAGGLVATFTCVTENTWKDKTTEEWKTQAEYHRCVVFGKPAGTIEEYLHKGQQIYLEGRVQTRSWEKDGVKRYATEIVVQEFRMLGGSHKSNDPQKPSAAPQAPQGDFQDDDIPF